MRSTAATRQDSTRVPALDGIRGVAVGLVLLYHFREYQQSYAARDPRWLVPVAKLFDAGSGVGWIGVQLFFVLSGFLITGILYCAKERPGYFRGFYARRSVRILPLYYAVLILHLVWLSRLKLPPWADVHFVVAHQGWYWTFLSNFLFVMQHWHRLTSHLWTLAIEEQFYLVWPVVVLFLGRRRLMQLCLGLLGLGVVLRAILLVAHVPAVDLYLLTPTQLDGLAMGAFLALALRGEGPQPFVLRHGRALTLAAMATLIAVFIARGRSFMLSDPLVALAGYSALAVVFGAITFIGATASRATAVGATLAHPVLRFLGRYSYAIYLLHMPVIQLWAAPQREEARLVHGGMPPFVAHALYVVVVTAAIVLAALISWHCLEKPFLSLRPRAQPQALAEHPS